MKNPAAIGVAVRFCVAALLAGCGTSQSLAPAAVPVSEASSRTAHPRSGILPGAKNEDLLFVNAVRPGSGDGQILAYTYPGGKPVGTLGHFGNPGELCSDTAGNLFVTIGGFEGLNPSVQEYSHEGQWRATLDVPGVWATSCSVDPTTGNLAVLNGDTNVYIYQGAKGTPVTYDSGLDNTGQCAFDGAGNLFVTGYVRNNETNKLIEMPAGAYGSFQTIKLDRPIFPADVQWDGTDLAVGTASANIYRMDVSQGRARTVSRVHLDGVGKTQFWISGATIARATTNRTRIGIWNYPEGRRHKNVTKQGLPSEYQVLGVTVSLSSNRQH